MKCIFELLDGWTKTIEIPLCELDRLDYRITLSICGDLGRPELETSVAEGQSLMAYEVEFYTTSHDRRTDTMYFKSDRTMVDALQTLYPDTA